MWHHALKKPSLQTVDSFQGSECSVVCLSVVRSSSMHGFLNDFQRMNVALTRAQDLLVVFANVQGLLRPGRGGGESEV